MVPYPGGHSPRRGRACQGDGQALRKGPSALRFCLTVRTSTHYQCPSGTVASPPGVAVPPSPIKGMRVPARVLNRLREDFMRSPRLRLALDCAGVTRPDFAAAPHHAHAVCSSGGAVSNVNDCVTGREGLVRIATSSGRSRPQPPDRSRHRAFPTAEDSRAWTTTRVAMPIRLRGNAPSWLAP